MSRHRKTIWAYLALAITVSPLMGEECVYPSADGTISDGGIDGRFDGTPDAWDWTFDRSGSEGAITLATETPESSVERRVVFEYDLSDVTINSPMRATLSFALRGVSVYPFPNVNVHVYAYPADLAEVPGDFLAGPATLVGSVTVVALQESTLYSIDVSEVANETQLSGVRKLGFRFQIDHETPHATNQAFLDAQDSEPQSKPYLTINAVVLGDIDQDGDVDMSDFAGFVDCLAGPDTTPEPQTAATAAGCRLAFDLDRDGDVDLADFAPFQRYLPAR